MVGVFEFCVVAGSLWIFFWLFLPWVSKLACLYTLHTIRGQIYAVSDDFPSARGTLFYRDAEFLVTYAICLVRDGTYDETIAYAAAMLNTERAVDRAAPRWAAYQAQRTIYSTPDGKAAQQRIAKSVRDIGPALSIRAVGGNPVTLVAMVAVGLFGAIASIARALFSRNGDGVSAPPSIVMADADKPEASISSAVAVTAQATPVPSIYAMAKRLEERMMHSSIPAL